MPDSKTLVFARFSQKTDGAKRPGLPFGLHPMRFPLQLSFGIRYHGIFAPNARIRKRIVPSSLYYPPCILLHYRENVVYITYLQRSAMMTSVPANCLNTRCPWSGKPVQADSLTEYRGNVVGFCNTGCRDKFEQVVRQFEELLAAEEKASGA